VLCEFCGGGEPDEVDVDGAHGWGGRVFGERGGFVGGEEEGRAPEAGAGDDDVDG